MIVNKKNQNIHQSNNSFEDYDEDLKTSKSSSKTTSNTVINIIVAVVVFFAALIFYFVREVSLKEATPKVKVEIIKQIKAQGTEQPKRQSDAKSTFKAKSPKAVLLDDVIPPIIAEENSKIATAEKSSQSLEVHPKFPLTTIQKNTLQRRHKFLHDSLGMRTALSRYHIKSSELQIVSEDDSEKVAAIFEESKIAKDAVDKDVRTFCDGACDTYNKLIEENTSLREENTSLRNKLEGIGKGKLNELGVMFKCAGPVILFYNAATKPNKKTAIKDLFTDLLLVMPLSLAVAQIRRAPKVFTFLRKQKTNT